MNLVLLSATLLALLCGPLLYVMARRRVGLLAFLDGFVVVAIGGLVLLELLPDTLAAGGLAALGFLALGALGPTLLEHQLHHAQRAHVAALALAIAGLVLHSIGDGTALAPAPDGAPRYALAIAIAVHSLPVGLMVWWLLYPTFGALLPGLAIAAMSLGTLGGYVFADAASSWLGATGWAWLQALVAGSIMHVVLGRPHLEESSVQRRSRPPFEGLGNLSALVALVLLERLHGAGHAHHDDFGGNLLTLALPGAIALVAAWVVGAALAARLPWPDAAPSWRALLGSALQADAGDALRAHRARSAAGRPLGPALTMLIASASLAPAALLLSLPLLGAGFALLRLLAALLLALALLALLRRPIARAPMRVFRPLATSAPLPLGPLPRRLSPLQSDDPPEACDAATRPPTGLAALRARVDHGAPWVIVGWMLAALALPYLHELPWSQLPAALLLPALTLAGALAGGNLLTALPLAAVLASAGLPRAPLLAFLLAGPLLDPMLLTALWRLHGRRLALAWAGAVFGLAPVLALLAAPLAPAPPAAVAADPATPAQWLGLGLFALLVAGSLLRRGGRGFFGGLMPHDHHVHS